MHHQGIIHRDIKPANLLWTEDRQSVKICDFGVSHFTAAAASQVDPNLYDEAGLTKTAGSPAFFAPEICHTPCFTFDETSSQVVPRGSQTSNSINSPSSPPTPTITKQIDIWALGVTFYCLLFGTPPWQGQTEYAMFRAICHDDFYLPDTMCRGRVPTGGRDRKPEGKEVGWCVVGLLEGLLEKDQDKRITLADMKVGHYRLEAYACTDILCQRIPWIQNGVREPERWLRETAPDTTTRVVITDEDTKRAIKPARFSYPGWVSRLTSTIKRVPLPLIPSSRTSSKGVPEPKITISTNLGERSSQSESLGRARSSRTRVVVDRQLKRFAFGNSQPTRSHTVSASRDHRRNSIGSTPQHSQSLSDPSSHIDRRFDPGPSSRRSMTMRTTGSSPRSQGTRRQSDSLRLPGSSASVSPASSPTTPEEQHSATRSRLKMRISQAIRSSSVKRAAMGVRMTRSVRNDYGPPARNRTSAETLDVLRASEDLGLTPAMRASSWGSPGTPAPVDDDGRASLDLTVSEAGGVGVQDFNKSVVRFGAGGYVDGPAAHGPAAAIYQPLSTPGASSSRSLTAGMTHSDSSSNSTTTAATPQQHVDSTSNHMRVMSPLSRGDDSDESLSSDVFEDTGTDEEEDDIIHVRSRRPSAILSRSANTSPLR